MKEDHRQDKLKEMEKSLTQLVEDLCLLLASSASSASSANPSQPETTKIPNSTVHEAVNPYLRLAHTWLSGYHLPYPWRGRMHPDCKNLQPLQLIHIPTGESD
ncbi:hypothetical protein ACE6H2_016846 [Prunus campanulata]